MKTDVEAAASAGSAFVDRFGTEPEGVWAAPGRVNVIGEHTDYNDGFVLPVALPHTTRAAVARRTDGRVAFASLQGDGDIVELGVGELAPGRPEGWAGYPAGVVDGMKDRLAGGIAVLVDTDVPVGAGLSSSAALTCSVALALRDLVAPELTRQDLVELAHRSENDFVGAPTGILDQSAALLCTAGNALFLDTRERTSEQAAHRLGVRSLRDVADAAGLAPLEDDDMLLRRARHIVTENARVLEVVAMLRGAGDPREIGPVLTAGHVSLRDDFEISTVELDACVEAALAAGAHGARMVGGGFGGSAIVLVDSDRRSTVTTAVTERFAAEGYEPARTFVAVPSAGARRLS